MTYEGKKPDGPPPTRRAYMPTETFELNLLTQLVYVHIYKWEQIETGIGNLWQTTNGEVRDFETLNDPCEWGDLYEFLCSTHQYVDLRYMYGNYFVEIHAMNTVYTGLHKTIWEALARTALKAKGIKV